MRFNQSINKSIECRQADADARMLAQIGRRWGFQRKTDRRRRVAATKGEITRPGSQSL